MPQTGPKSANGKAKVSRNAVKHGLLAETPVVDSVESQADWESHLKGIIDSHEPGGYMETLLTHRIAILFWRTFRVTRYETEMLATDLDFDYEGETIMMAAEKLLPAQAIAQRSRASRKRQFIAARLIPGELTGPKIMRYESHLHRQLLQTLHELEARQARRRGEPVTLARVDITAPPGTWSPQ